MFSAIFSRPYLILVLTPLFWGGNVVAGKLALGHVDPYTLIVTRWTGALLMILPFAIGPLKRDWPAIRKAWPMLALYGALGFSTFNVLMYVAVYFTSGVNGSIEQALIPALVMLGNFMIFGVRARRLQIIGVTLTIVGVAITAVHGDFGRIASFTVNFGDGLVVLACLAYAAYSLTLRFRPAVHWMSFLAVTFVAAIAAGLVFQSVMEGGPMAVVDGIARTTGFGWLIIAYVIVFPSILAQLFYARGVELIGANRASLFINLIPVFGTILALVILGEPFETYHMVTAVLVVIGIMLAEFAARAKEKAA